MTLMLQGPTSRRILRAGERTSPCIPVRSVPRLPSIPSQSAVGRSAAILFIDLAGFTRVSERVGLEGTHAMLAAFYRIVDSTVLDAGGKVLNYLGDGALIAFTGGSPREAAARAVQTALALVERVGDWISTQAECSAPAGVRIGAHLGDVLIAQLGDRARGSVTIIGDDVNVASRLLELAPGRGAAIVFSGALLEAAGPVLPPAAKDHLGPGRLVPIRGRSRRLVVLLWSRPAIEPAGAISRA